MAIRTALIGTGNCGSLALKQLVSDARFDLTGVWVSSDAKVGKDAGELAGLDVTTGVDASDDLDAIIAAKPECIVYCAMGDTRLPDAMADVRKILAAGVNVSKTLREKVIRPSSSPGSTRGSRPTCCRLPWRGRVRASSRCAPWRSPTTPPTTGQR